VIGDPLREFDDGITYWAAQPRWPADLHNALYQHQDAITDGTFSHAWWTRTRRKLHDWRATRGASYTDLDARFAQHRSGLVTVWQTVIRPHEAHDITDVTWDQVQALPALAALIKPTQGRSGVFASKLSHFIAPRLFPVLDRTALPGGRHDYRSYFTLVQDTWDSTSLADRDALKARLTTLVEARSGGPVFDRFPIVNKIVELRLIGRHHPAPPPRPSDSDT
jgi:hypothetical protein